MFPVNVLFWAAATYGGYKLASWAKDVAIDEYTAYATKKKASGELAKFALSNTSRQALANMTIYDYGWNVSIYFYADKPKTTYDKYIKDALSAAGLKRETKVNDVSRDAMEKFLRALLKDVDATIVAGVFKALNSSKMIPGTEPPKGVTRESLEKLGGGADMGPEQTTDLERVMDAMVLIHKTLGVPLGQVVALVKAIGAVGGAPDDLTKQAERMARKYGCPK